MKGALASPGWFYVHECRCVCVCVCVRAYERWGWHDGDLSFGEGGSIFSQPTLLSGLALYIWMGRGKSGRKTHCPEADS